MTEAGETDGFDAFDHVAALRNHGVRLPDMVLLNSTPVDRGRLENYRGEAAELVDAARQRFEEAGIELVEAPLLGSGEHAKHDSDKLGTALAVLATRRDSKPRILQAVRMTPGASA